jgi:cell division protein FtsZ
MNQEELNPSIIKVIGVGGAGCNIVQSMFYNEISDVDFVICDTDSQSLITNSIEHKILLGQDFLKDIGTGLDVKIGERATIDVIGKVFEPSIQIAIIVAGMGGETGTSVAPVIARLAKERGLLTIGMVTIPHQNEGEEKQQQSIEGIRLFKQNCDSVVVFSHNKIGELEGYLTMDNIYGFATNDIIDSTKALIDILTGNGNGNCDFQDLKMILKNSGFSVITSANASGDDRACRAVEEVINWSIARGFGIKNPNRLLIILTSSEEHEVTFDEQQQVLSHIYSVIDYEPSFVKVGQHFDYTLTDKLQVTIVLGGVEELLF